MFKKAEQRWQQRWQARQQGPGRVRLEGCASRVIERRTPVEVWAFVKPAESSVLIDPSVVRAFTVPGTGPGIGEQQCVVMLEDGREVAHLDTVVAVEDGVWAETSSHAGNVEFRSRTVVEAVDGGTRLVLTQSFLGNPLAPVRDLEIAREQLRSHAGTYVARVKALLEGPSLAALLPPSS